MILCMCDASARHVGSGLRDVAPPLCGVGGRWDLPLLLGYDVQGHPCSRGDCGLAAPPSSLGDYVRRGSCVRTCVSVCVLHGVCGCVRGMYMCEVRPHAISEKRRGPKYIFQLAFFLQLAPQALTQHVVAYKQINICSSGAVCCDLV